MNRIYLLFYFLPFFGFGQAVDFSKLELHISFEPYQGKVVGSVHHVFKAAPDTDSIFLNAIQMEYSEVLLNGREVRYGADAKGIWVLPDSLRAENELRISYSCIPRRGVFFVGWNDTTHRARKQIWTQGQGIDHRHWIPHKDDQNDKVTLDLHIDAPTPYTVVANGRLQEKTPLSKGSTRWHYSTQQPMSTYLLAIVAGEYASIQTASASNIPLTQYYYPERAQDYTVYYAHNEAIFNFLEATVGVPYPWQNYKQVPVANFQHGAMENTTATIFGDFFMADSLALPDKNYPYVNAHELAHQWFGNLVTATESEHHWLHEGFATYYQWLTEAELYGTAHFDWQRKLGADQIFTAAEQDSFPLMHARAGTARFYQKGAWVLYMMEQQCPQFKAAIKDYLTKHAFGNVETSDWLSALKSRDCDLEAFAEFWIETPGEGHYEVRELAHKGKQLRMHVRVIGRKVNPSHPQLQVVYKNGTEQLFAVDTGVVVLPLKSELWFWNFNPNEQQLAKVWEFKSNARWAAQYAHGTDEGNYQGHLLDRYEALHQFDAPEFTTMLFKILMEDKEFFALRALAAQKLLAHDYAGYLPFVHQLLLKKYEDPGYEAQQNLPLKKELVPLLNDHSKATLDVLEALAFANSYDLREMVLFKRVQHNKPEANRWLYDLRYAQEPGVRGQNVYVASLGLRVVLYQDTTAIKVLKDLSTPAFDFLTRMQVIECFQALDYLDESMLPAYFEALFNTNRKLLRTARTALQLAYKKPAYKALVEAYIAQERPNWNDFQKRLVARTFSP